MTVALVHDYLNQYGGAERVLETLIDLFPQAHIYTLLHSKERTFDRFAKNIHQTSFLDFAIARRHHRPFIPLMPMAISRLNLGNEYDLVISDSAGFAKGVRHGRSAFHLSYCYTPLRYAWEISSYFPNPAFKTFFKPAFDYLRRWDFQAAQRPDVLLAVSNYIAGKIKEYYKRDANVLFPPVDYQRFNYSDELQRSKNPGSYYLAVGRLLHYKKFDLLMETFRELDLPLKIVGRGPEENKVRHKASLTDNIEFIPFVTDEELHALYNQAEAFVFPQVEDFGLVAAEAQACGTPVIALARGGALEIVIDGVTGVLFEQQTVEDIMQAIRRFQNMSFDRKQISQISQRFSTERFKNGILAQIPACLLEKYSLLRV